MPTKENLLRRTISDNSVCDRCKLAPKSTIHSLWSCTELDVVWEDNSLWNCRRTNTFIDFKELLSWLITNQHHLELFSVMAWLVWTQRNQIRLNKPNSSPHSIASLVKEHLAEFKAPPMSSAPSLQWSRWQHPMQGVVKINCDGAIFADKKKSGIGVVI